MDIGKRKRVIFVEPLKIPTEPESPIEDPLEEPEPVAPSKKPTPA
ncbi:MAG: hypothetical protein OEX97_00525 [Acidimicrobiia bacterium]|nr:hypothetical protein [Acidimicrobiia bacterium]